MTTTKKQEPTKRRQFGWGGRPSRSDEAPKDPRETELAVTLEGETPRYASADASFAIWNARRESDGARVTVKGALARCAGGELLSCTGKWTQHPKHGWSFSVDAYKSTLPQTATGIQTWLQTRVKGIGPVFAKAITDRYGDKAFEVIDADPKVLYDLRTERGATISRKQVENLINAWGEIRAMRQIETWLFGAGVTANLADRLYRRYGDDVITVLESDPYRIVEISGVGFKIADKIALGLGWPPDDPRRVRAGIMFCIEEGEKDGHSFVTLDQLFGRVGTDLAVGNKNLIADEAGKLLRAEAIVVEADEDARTQRVYRRVTWELEARVARRVRTLMEKPISPLLTRHVRPTLPEGTSADEARAKGLYVPTDLQWEAVEMVANRRIGLLTGGPGVGKCIGPNTPILMNGTLIDAQDVWDRYSTSPIWDGEGEWSEPSVPLTTAALVDDLRMTATPITKLYRQKVRETLRKVTLDDGAEILITQEHKLLGEDGWTNELAVGDRVAVPKVVPWAGQNVDPDLVRLLAWQIAEGHERDRKADGTPVGSAVVRITQGDRAVLEGVRASAEAWASRVGVQMNTMPIHKTGRGAYCLYISSKAYRDWLIGHGYAWGQRSAGKRIPDFIVGADDETIALFLNQYIAAEGNVNVSFRSVEVTSASRRIIDQLSLMARRLEMRMTIRHTRKHATNGTRIKRDYWIGRFSGPALRVFASEVGLAIADKDAKLQRAASVEANPNRDLVPCRDILLRVRERTGLSRHQLGVSSSYLDGSKDMAAPRARRFLATLRRIASGEAAELWSAKPTNRYTDSTTALYEAIDADEVATMADDLENRIERQVWFASIVRIDDVEYDGFVYDFEVQGPHNYVACNVLAHNTATMDIVLKAANAEGKTVALTAPTGKAARRMTELTGEEGKTIHRLLEWSPIEGGFQRDADDPLEVDLVVCDEASMLSLDLADALLSAIGPGTSLLLVGDPDQLPPVGIGKFLSDLIDAQVVPQVHLDQVFRQAAGSMIITNAHRINRGEMPYLSHAEAQQAEGRDMDKDAFWISRKTPEETADLVVSMAAERVPKTFGLDALTDVMILAPMYKGACGLEVLNEKMQQQLNPHGKALNVRGIRVGDRVVQNRNDYTDGRETSNGQVGVVKAYDPDSTEAHILLDDERTIMIPTGDMDTWSLAWALSIHKSQGSQWPAVVTAVSAAHYVMLSRALTYTAVTRAQKLVVIVGETRAMNMAVGKVDSRRRNSRLIERIHDAESSGELF